VHAQDIRLPLGLPRATGSGQRAAGASSASFTLSSELGISMARRAQYVDQLDGPGVGTLRKRVRDAEA
jgi:hypothetical protein